MNKLENIQLSEDLEVKSNIICQINHNIKDLNTNNIAIKTNTDKRAEDKNKK